MALTTLIAAKELAQSYRPLLLATVTFANGDVLRLASMPLNASVSAQYGGYDWDGRISQQDVQAVQSQDAQGISRPPSATLHIADPDKYVWSNFEMNSSRGFLGATLQLDLIAYDVVGKTFSSDVQTKFIGTCNPPESDAEMLTLSATARTNLSQTFLPPGRIQSRCIWVFPPDAASQADSVYEDSQFHECGYNPSGGQGTAGFTDCGYTKAHCQARGMYALGRFSGITYTPPQTWRSKSNTDRKTEEGTNSVNDAKWGEPYPLIYGAGWVQPPIMNVIGDANSTRMEAVLCVGAMRGAVHTDPGAVQKVVVNGEEVPFVTGSPDKTIFRWDWVNPGNRNGAPNTDAEYDGNGDPYGSLACIEIVVPIKAAQSNAVPDVRVLLGWGQKLWMFEALSSVSVSGGVGTLNFATTNIDCASPYSDYLIVVSGNSYGAVNGRYVGAVSSTSSTSATFNASGVANGTGTGGFVRYLTDYPGQGDNPAWVILDALTWAGIRYPEIDIQSFINAAKVCATQIYYTDQTGTSTNLDADGSAHLRYRVSASIRDRRSAAEILTGLANGCKANLDWVNGLLRLTIQSTLGEQQPAAVSGSNYNTAVSSVAYDGSSKSGYVAYKFDGSNILRDSSGKSTFKISRLQTSAMPNRVSFAFQDRNNQWVQDSLNEADSQAIARVTFETPGNMQVVGPNTFDQAMRIAATYEAGFYRGNPAGDARGTMIAEFQTTYKACHLRAGDIVMVSDSDHGISSQLFRVKRIQTSTDYETMTVTAHWHYDAWYVDSYGQTQAGGQPPQQKDPKNRAPRPWAPDTVIPPSGDAMYDPTELTFSLAPDYSHARDGSALVSLAVGGVMPLNQFASLAPPTLVVQASVASSGGSLAAGTYWLAVCARDSSGNLSAPSILGRADIASGTANTATLATPAWDAATVHWSLFAGTDPRRLTYQTGGSGTPTSVTLSAYNAASWGVPDAGGVVLRARVKQVVHAGIFGAALTGTGTNALTITGAGWTTNHWAGRIVSVIGKGDNSAVPVANFLVSANTADTLTVSPDPAGLGIVAGDVVVMRTKPSIAGNVLTDADWVNGLSGGAGLAAGAEVGNYYLIVAGTARGQYQRITANTSTAITTLPFRTALDSTSVGIVVSPTWQSTADSLPIANLDQTATISIAPDIQNLYGEAVLVQVATVGPDGRESDETISPMREAWIAGVNAAAVSPGYVTLSPVAGVVTIDLAAGANFRVVLASGTAYTMAPPVFTGGSITAGASISVYFDQDATGGRPMPAFSNAAGGFVSNAGASIPAVDTASTRTAVVFTFHGSLWSPDSAITGLSLT
jgi:hypothetical protein